MPLVVLQTKHHVRPPPSTFTRGGAETFSSSVLVIYGCLTDYSKDLRQHLVLGSSASARVWLTSSHKLQSACGLWPPQGSTGAGSRSTCPRVMLAGFSSSQAVGLRASVPTLPVSWKFVSCHTGFSTEHLRTGKRCPSARQHGQDRSQSFCHLISEVTCHFGCILFFRRSLGPAHTQGQGTT